MQRVMTTSRSLFIRELYDNMRNYDLLLFRFVQSCILSTCIGCVFFDLNNAHVDIQNKSGALFVISVVQMISNVYLYSLPYTLQYDFDRNKYPLIVYHVIKTCTDIPFQMISSIVFAIIVVFMTSLTSNTLSFVYFTCMISLCTSSFGYCMTLMHTNKKRASLVIIPMLLTSGFLINNKSIPVYISWIRLVNPLYYGYSGLSIIVWRDVLLNETCLYSHGDDVLVEYDIHTRGNTFSLFRLFIMYWFVGYLFLMFRVYRT
jgi:ABC-type multidrug transport system permease subunit